MMPPQETTRISRDALVRRRLYAVNYREILIGPLRLLEALLGQITQVDGALGSLLRQDAASSSEREDLGASGFGEVTARSWGRLLRWHGYRLSPWTKGDCGLRVRAMRRRAAGRRSTGRTWPWWL
jgi:hypothetical protein